MLLKLKKQTTDGNGSRGFTLVELLVVIAIIGILIALLLPAVQAAREAARRMDCSNRVKQISLAMHNYADVHKAFPCGVSINPLVVDQAATTHTSLGAGNQFRSNWAISLLPFIEQSALFEKYRFDAPDGNCDALNQEFNATPVDAFSCPSDRNVNMPRTPGSGVAAPYQFVTSSYKGIAGRSLGTLTINPGGGFWDNDQMNYLTNNSWRGVLHIVGRFVDGAGNVRNLSYESFGSVSDGTSNTAVMAEMNLMTNQPGRRPFWSYAYACYTIGTAMPHQHLLNTEYERCVQAVADGGYGLDHAACLRGFGSKHTSGLNSGLLDGSVRFVSNTVDTNVWMAYASISDGENPGTL